MVALKAADVDRFVARPDAARPIVLVFGPDAGLVHERLKIVHASVDDPNDPFALVRPRACWRPSRRGWPRGAHSAFVGGRR
jgi:DNA polymerase-3 subunit delta